jgi:hypothetical protein
MSSSRDSKPTSTNLRREARVDACIKVSVVRGRRTESFDTAAVSFKGLFHRTHEPPPLRSLVRLRVIQPVRVETGGGQVPHATTCEIEAHAMAVHVARADADGRHGVGVQFWGLAGRERALWDDFVRELMQARRVAKNLAESGEHPAGASTPSGVRAAPLVALVALVAPHRAAGDDYDK